MDKYVLIIAGGELVDKDVIYKYVENADFIIGADKGAEMAYEYDFKLDLLIGDFDSIDENILGKLDTEILKYPKEKDKTDLELSLDYVLKKEYKSVKILNALGNRLDHTIGNVFLMEKYNNLDIKIIDNNTEVFLLNEKEIILENKIDYILSIVPITKSIEIKSLQGTKYKLKDEKINRGSTLCISNLIKKRQCLISIKKGRALIIITKNMED
ncbi:MAG: thiamine diphosphokinase [Eubacteriales bacterium]